MRLTFLGGADEVGASCTLVEISGRRILVDCGIRMTARAGDTLPWLAPIADAGGIEAIVLTHAHMDHSGALPVIHQSYPHVPVYMTAATLSITTILLMDSLKIMQSEMEQEGEIPLYPLPAVEMMIGATRTVPFGQSIDIFDGDVRLTYYPAGHIMGAAAVLIEGDDGSVLMSGDISVADQKTIPGMILPPVKPDIMVVESTYGGRLHASRTGEEFRLVQQVLEVIERRGSILFPAFAVGRAQEVILVLMQAMEHQKLPQIPIFIDGMVRAVCQAYASYPELMTPWLRNKTQKRGHPFFYDGSPAQIVYDPRKRDSYARQRPSIIVSSSGMLTGGPSPIYAQKLASDPLSFIAITGYQDEESPGRQVQEVAKAGGGMLKLGDQHVSLECGVGTYGLSAHADTQQIVSIASGLQPREMALVHGDANAREALKKALQLAGIDTVHLPHMGYTLEYTSSQRRKRKPVPNTMQSSSTTPLPPAQSLHFENLNQVADTLHTRDKLGRLYTVQEILLAWGDPEAANRPEEIDRVARFLGAKASPFQQDKKRPFLYRLRERHFAPGTNKSVAASESPNITPSPDNPMDSFRALQQVDRYLGEAQGLYKRSTQLDQSLIVLSFYFPKTAGQKYQDIFERIRQETGWNVEIRDTPHQNALVEAAEALLSPHLSVTKRPSLHLLAETVTVSVSRCPSQEEAHTWMRAFFEQTGFRLEFKDYPIAQPPEVTGTQQHPLQTTEPEASPNLASPTDEPIPDEPIPWQKLFPPNVSSNPLEINVAYHTIRQAFADVAELHQPLKIGKKDDLIEIAFISPTIGERYRERLDILSQHTGWPIQIKPRADQHRIKEHAKAIIPKTWGLSKEPGFLEETQELSLSITIPPAAEEFRELTKAFQEATGFKLSLKLKR